jgi:hypothetical protein
LKSVNQEQAETADAPNANTSARTSRRRVVVMN